jgi:regulator of sirC expression with transglutaminase-like and TPR domain
LGRAALAIARVEYPDLHAEPWLSRLDDLAARSGAATLRGRRALDRLRAFLFEEEGFRGNSEEYYDPRNTFLNDVLVRRLGIPITLSVVTMEVGRRVGLAVEGVGLPAHFVVAVAVDGAQVVMDPFGGGRAIDRSEAEAIVARAAGRPVKLTDAHFAKATRTEIVTRMLNNLKGIYAHRRQWEKALAVIDRLLVIEEGDAALRRERSSALVRLRRKTAPLN